MLADFHLHSNHSDGRLAPAVLVDLVADAGISLMSLTDHDTTAGHEAAQRQASARGVRFVPGIEMTTYGHGRVIHTLGFGCDGASEELRAANAVAAQVWDDNQRRWVEALAHETEDVDWARDFRDHPVRLPALIERLCLAGVDGGDPKKVHARFKAFFAALPPTAYAALPDPAGAAAIIRRAGGIAVLAHPWHLHESGLAASLLAHCDGLEATYLQYSLGQQDVLRELCARQGKLCSGGSDYHGYFESEYRSPQFEPSPELVARLGIDASRK